MNFAKSGAHRKVLAIHSQRSFLSLLPSWPHLRRALACPSSTTPTAQRRWAGTLTGLLAQLAGRFFFQSEKSRIEPMAFEPAASSRLFSDPRRRAAARYEWGSTVFNCAAPDTGNMEVRPSLLCPTKEQGRLCLLIHYSQGCFVALILV